MTYQELIKGLEDHIKKDFEEGANIIVNVWGHKLSTQISEDYPSKHTKYIEIIAEALNGDNGRLTSIDFYNEEATLEDLINKIEDRRSNTFYNFLMSCYIHRASIGYSPKNIDKNVYDELTTEINHKFLDKIADKNASIHIISIDYYNFTPSIVRLSFRYDNQSIADTINISPSSKNVISSILMSTEFIKGVLGLQLASTMRKYPDKYPDKYPGSYPDNITNSYEGIVRRQFSFEQFRRALEQFNIEPVI